MSNINSEALVQECFKRRFFLKISSELTGKELCARVSFIIKVQAESIKLNVYVHIIWHMYFPVKFLEFLRTPLRAPTIL